MSSLAGLLNHLRAVLTREGVGFAVGGAFALAAHGHPRFTADLDLRVLINDLEQVHRGLQGSRFHRVNEVTFEDTETGLTLDVFPVEDEAQRAAFDRAVSVPLHGADDVRTLDPSGLRLMLLREATQGNPDKRPARLRDVELLAHEPGIDWPFVGTWAARMGYEKAYEDVHFAGKPPL